MGSNDPYLALWDHDMLVGNLNSWSFSLIAISRPEIPVCPTILSIVGGDRGNRFTPFLKVLI